MPTTVWPWYKKRYTCSVFLNFEQAQPDGMTIASVAIANEIGGRLVPREGLGDLPRDPLRRRMVGEAVGMDGHERQHAHAGREEGSYRDRVTSDYGSLLPLRVRSSWPRLIYLP
jgi:hypothetical protein